MTLTDALLDPLLARDPKGPRITYYDDATGERIELSTVTLANWAAKTANLLRDELGAGPGSVVAVLLPPHWQTAAVLLGTWWIGAETRLGPPPSRFAPAPEESGPADIALCTADRITDADDAVAGGSPGEVAVLSLDPFGKPVADLPIGLTDYATAVRVHGDQIVPERFPGPALDGLSVDEVLTGARTLADSLGLTASDRVMSLTPLTVETLLAVLASGASLVQVANPDPALLTRRRESEKVNRTLD